MTDSAAEVLSVADTAKVLGRSTEQVRRYLREGVLAGRRVGGQWFVDKADVEAFTRRRTGGPDFIHQLFATEDHDPLGDVIGIGGSGGGDIAGGRARYLRALSGVERQ
jgi:excisionase family DNA binding protein